MNRQQMFDKVKKRLFDGTGRAMRLDLMPECAYENDDGLRCAVGILFPDEMPEEIKESRLTLLWLIKDDEVGRFVPDYIKDNSELARDLQLAHDETIHWNGNTFNEKGIKNLKEIAKKYRLEYNNE